MGIVNETVEKTLVPSMESFFQLLTEPLADLLLKNFTITKDNIQVDRSELASIIKNFYQRDEEPKIEFDQSVQKIDKSSPKIETLVTECLTRANGKIKNLGRSRPIFKRQINKCKSENLKMVYQLKIAKDKLQTDYQKISVTVDNPGNELEANILLNMATCIGDTPKETRRNFIKFLSENNNSGNKYYSFLTSHNYENISSKTCKKVSKNCWSRDEILSAYGIES